ncbi:MAG TPA: carbohydrate-binding domain-containing protein [Candidatus Thermoplasmatota archaeon]|nr:carbohydrate-binding domain-containing protein [Candidatus Thermoplasmatota archaeon]
MKKSAGALLAIALLAPAVTVLPTASAAPSPALGFGMNMDAVDKLSSHGARPDYGLFWVGVWTAKSGWDGIDRWLRAARDKGVTPVIQWWYWGDDISPSCVDNGCWSKLHNAQKSRAQWNDMTRKLAERVNSIMGSRGAIIVLETEFNKGGITQSWYAPKFDSMLTAQAAAIRSIAPNAKIVIGFGNWDKASWDRFPKTIATSDYLGFQTMRGSTKDSHSTYMSGGQAALDAARYLHNKYKKPTFLTDLALSSYPSDSYEKHQNTVLKWFFDHAGDFKAAGVKGMIYRGYKDSPTFNLANYYGWAERYWGLTRADGSAKPSLWTWVNGVKAVRGGAVSAPSPDPSPAPTPTLTTSISGPVIEAEAMAKRTGGGVVSDGAASGGRTWKQWSNGHVAQDMKFPDGGSHTVSFVARGQYANGAWPKAVLSVGGQAVATFTVGSSTYKTYAATVSVPAGAVREVKVAFVNDYAGSAGDRNLYVDRVAIGSGGSAAPAPQPTGGAPGKFEAESFASRPVGGRYSDGSASGGAGWNIWSNGEIRQSVSIPESGTYKFTIRAKGDKAGGVAPKMSLKIDGATKATWTVSATSHTDHVAYVHVPAGARTVAIAFTNDARIGSEDRNLRVDFVDVRR